VVLGTVAAEHGTPNEPAPIPSAASGTRPLADGPHPGHSLEHDPMRRLLLISVVPLVVACSGPAAPPSAPATVGGGPASAATAPRTESQPAAAKPEPKVASQAPSQSKPATEPKPEVQAAAPAFPKATIAPPSDNQGVALGQPFKSGANGAAVRVTNTTDQVMTFTVKLDIRKGADTITLTSKVADLAPKQSWVAFSAGSKLMPSDPDSVAVAVETVHSATPTSEKAEAMKAITVSEPKKVEGSTNVTVEITNNDPSKTHTLSVRSAYLQGDEMIAHGEAGSPPRLQPGETRTVTVRPVTSLKTYDRIEVMAKLL
jgi:hypothetical protein